MSTRPRAANRRTKRRLLTCAGVCAAGAALSFGAVPGAAVAQAAEEKLEIIRGHALKHGSGGPEDSTLFYALYMFQRSWKYLDLGYGSAMAWALFIIVVAITTIIFRSQRRWVHYGR